MDRTGIEFHPLFGVFFPVKRPREDGTEYLRVFSDAADLADCGVMDNVQSKPIET